VDDCGPLGGEEVGDRAAEAGVGDVMGGEGRHRLIAARQFVPALRARLGAGKAAGDSGIDRLVIAKLEVEIGHFLGRAPIAAVERLGADHVERAGDRLAVAQRQDQQQPVRHPLADQGEEGAGQIGLAPFAGAGVLVEDPEGVPMRLGMAAPAEDGHLEPGNGRRRSLRIALRLRDDRVARKVVERTIAPVQPVELAVGPDQPAGALEQGGLVRG
jgi:hypothetical protein